MDVKKLIKKLRENKAEISLNKYVDRLYEAIKALEFIEGAVKKALDEGKASFSVCDSYTIKICLKLFGNARQYSYGYSGMNWHEIKITELGIKD